MKHLFLVVLIALSSAAVNAQGKTVYVSTDEIFQSIYQVRIADSLIVIEGNKMNDYYEYAKQSINDSIQQFFKDSVTMSVEKKEARRTALQKDISEMGRLEADLKDSLQRYKEKLILPIRKLMMDVVVSTGKSKGATTILYRENAVIIPPGSDITAEVIRKLNALKPKK